MKALLESIAISYAKSKSLDYITDEAREYAAKKLGLDKQQGNPKYAISLGGQSINPINMLKRMGLNKGIKSIMGGGLSKAMLPMLGIGAFAYGMNKAFPMSRQDKLYSSFSANKMGDPYGYASQMISGSGENKDPFGINTVSAFGDYGKYQQNLYNKLSKKDNLSNYDKSRLDLADEVTKSIKEDYRTDQYNGGGSKNDGGGSNIGGANEGNPGANKSAQGYSQHFARGGIASL